jgi:hypothetical protein
MSHPLVIYLNDHIGGAQIALETLRSMREEQDHPKFRRFADSLYPQIAEDDATLRGIIESFGEKPSSTKQLSGWLLEKGSRIKLGHTGSADFALFESLELLCLGILGKLSLWRALGVVTSEPKLQAWDFLELSHRAQNQSKQVEQQRIALARSVLRSDQ